MNRREQVVLVLLTVALVVGIGAASWKRAELRRQAARNPVGVVQAGVTRGPMDSPVIPRPVDINQATSRELDGLPGIGPVLAARIAEYRKRKGGFRNVGELRAVAGIGEKRYSALKDFVTVGPAGSDSDSGK